MASSLTRGGTLRQYAVARFLRFFPPVAVLWGAAGLLWLWRDGEPTEAFLKAAPLLLHNFARLKMGEWEMGELIWIPTWFLAALFQLQVSVFVFRRWLVRCSPLAVGAVAISAGVIFRYVTAVALGVHDGRLSVIGGESLYWLPYTHLEAMVFGALVGLNRFSFPRPVIFASALLVAALALCGLSVGHLPLATWGLPIGLPAHYEYLFGYPILALAAACLTQKTNPIGSIVLGWRLRPETDALISRCSNLTYFSYLAHGGVITFFQMGLGVLHLRAFGESPLGLVMLGVTVIATSFLVSFVIQYLIEWTADRREHRAALLSSGGPSPSA